MKHHYKLKAIANILRDCAVQKKVICYSKLQNELKISRKDIGQYLEQISLITNEQYGIFLSALVVHKNTLHSSLPMPGPGFFDMYYRITKNTNTSKKDIIKEQRRQIFNQDWNNLENIILEEINK